MKKKLFSLLALLMAVTTGAWADNTNTYMITATATVTGIGTKTGTLYAAEALPKNTTLADCYKAATGQTSVPGTLVFQSAEVTSGDNITLGTLDGWDTPFTIDEMGEGVITVTVTGLGSIPITISAKLNLTSTDGEAWTIPSMPGNDVELEVEYWTELKENDTPLAELTAQSGNKVPVLFTRSGLTAGAYSTVCLPFAFEAPEGCAFYTFVGVAQDASGEWFADVTAAEPPYLANTPYIFKSATATSVDFTNESVVAAASYSDANAKTVVSSDWTIQGTYSRIDLPKEGEHAYGFTSTAGKSVQNNDLEAGTFVYLVTGAWAAPFRAYLKYTGSDAAWQKGRTRSGAAALPSRITVRIVGGKGTATEIGTLRLETEDGEWYSLDGRRLSGKPATKGIYIKDGKKVIVK